MTKNMSFALFVLLSIVGICIGADSKIYFDNELLQVDKNIKEEPISHAVTKIALDINRVYTSIAPSDNVLFSPLSIASAMALMLLGAKGFTALELSQFLGVNHKARMNLDYRLKTLHEQFGSLLSNLVHKSDGYEIDAALGVFPQNTFPVKKDYIHQAENTYTSNVLPLDYQYRNFDALAIINKWVANKTHNRITHLLSGPPSPETTIIVASALYFSGNWKYPFLKEATKRVPFYVGKKPGSSEPEIVDVDLMVNSGEVPYLEDTKHNCQMIGLPYIGEEAYMYIILPNDKIELLMENLSEQELHTMINSARNTSVIYALPKMTLDNNIDLTNVLQGLGLVRTFNPMRADFRNIADGVFVDNILHKVEIEINEVGTKASAATLVSSFKSNSVPIVRVDRPFLFFIHHKRTDTIIFWGKIMKPTPYFPTKSKKIKSRRFH